MKASRRSVEPGARKLRALILGWDGDAGKPATLTCPECGGPISEIAEKSGPRYRCQVGHGFSLHALLIARLQDTERSLWHLASNSLEAANLSELLSREFRRDGLSLLARKYRDLGQFWKARFDIFRKIVIELPDGTFGEDAGMKETGK